jgi:hypothetical protein
MNEVGISSDPLPKTFQERFCERYQCPREQFVPRVFWRCLHRRALALAWLVRRIKPGFFAADFELVSELPTVRDMPELLSLIQRYREDCWMRRNFLHERLRIRISGHRVITLFKDLSGV